MQTEKEETLIKDIDYEGKKFALYTPSQTIDISTFIQYDGIILEQTKDEHLWDFTRELHGQYNPQLYLKPLFLLEKGAHKSEISNLFDGVIQSLRDLSKIDILSDRVNHLLEKLPIPIKDQNNEVANEVYNVGIICNHDAPPKRILEVFTEHPHFEYKWNKKSWIEINDVLTYGKKQVDILFCETSFINQTKADFKRFLEKPNLPEIVILDPQGEGEVEDIDYEFLDYFVKPPSMNSLNRLYGELKKKNSHITEKETETTNQRWMKKVLTFIHSRQEGWFHPTSARLSPKGFIYPFLKDVKDDSDLLHERMRLLGKLDEEGYLNAQFYESIYLCNHCLNALLFYRESCPHCKSTHLRQQDLVHHFRCAYVGPIEDFKQGSDYDLVCPKCDKRLRHIGVDYDKPASVYNCLNCERTFQDPIIRSHCLSCEHDEPVEYLIKQELFTYNITEKGSEVVLGARSLGIEKKHEPTSDEIYFFRYLVKEIERKKTADFPSSLACIDFHNIRSLYNQIGPQKGQQVRDRIFEIATDLLPGSAEILFNTPSQMLFIIPENKTENSKKELERLRQQIREVLRDNIHEFETEITVNVMPISKKKSPRAHLDELHAQRSYLVEK